MGADLADRLACLMEEPGSAPEEISGPLGLLP